MEQPQQQEAPELLLNKTYRHKSENGLTYRTQSFILNATGYEHSHQVTQDVIYVQLEKGDYPVGTKWVRNVEDFLNNFELIDYA